MTRPACENVPTELFYPFSNVYSAENTALARQICADCPVIDWCKRTFKDERHGVFFGTTPRERGFRVVVIDDDADE